MGVVVIVVMIVTGGKQSQFLALALGLGWSLTKSVYLTRKYAENVRKFRYSIIFSS